MGEKIQKQIRFILALLLSILIFFTISSNVVLACISNSNCPSGCECKGYQQKCARQPECGVEEWKRVCEKCTSWDVKIGMCDYVGQEKTV